VKGADKEEAEDEAKEYEKDSLWRQTIPCTSKRSQGQSPSSVYTFSRAGDIPRTIHPSRLRISQRIFLV
tara:strand:- start:48 stop:254 length:207 start_codon:yes stop_codon:yes gene_type:complete